MTAAEARASPGIESASTGGTPGEAQGTEPGKLSANRTTLPALATRINTEHQAAEQHAPHVCAMWEDACDKILREIDELRGGGN